MIDRERLIADLMQGPHGGRDASTIILNGGEGAIHLDDYQPGPGGTATATFMDWNSEELTIEDLPTAALEAMQVMFGHMVRTGSGLLDGMDRLYASDYGIPVDPADEEGNEAWMIEWQCRYQKNGRQLSVTRKVYEEEPGSPDFDPTAFDIEAVTIDLDWDNITTLWRGLTTALIYFQDDPVRREHKPLAGRRNQSDGITGITLRTMNIAPRGRDAYTLLPAQDDLVIAFGRMCAALPRSVREVWRNFEGMADLFHDMASTDLNPLISFYTDHRPFHPTVISACYTWAATYTAVGVAWGDLAKQWHADVAAQDVEAARPNAEFNDVPDGVEQGEAMTPYREALRDAHRAVFANPPADPTAQRDFFRGLWPMYTQLAAIAGVADGAHHFPGWLDDGLYVQCVRSWTALSHTLTGLADQAATVSELYEMAAGRVLGRHDDPRYNEHLANAGR